LSLAQTITAVIGALGVAVAGFSALKALAEYRKQGITKRSEIFLQMRSRLREDDSFRYICNLLEGDDERLRDVSLVEKDRFIGFLRNWRCCETLGLSTTTSLCTCSDTLQSGASIVRTFGIASIATNHCGRCLWTSLGKCKKQSAHFSMSEGTFIYEGPLRSGLLLAPMMSLATSVVAELLIPASLPAFGMRPGERNYSLTVLAAGKVATRSQEQVHLQVHRPDEIFEPHSASDLGVIKWKG
jgi:hypothetical protein